MAACELKIFNSQANTAVLMRPGKVETETCLEEKECVQTLSFSRTDFLSEQERKGNGTWRLDCARPLESTKILSYSGVRKVRAELELEAQF